MPDDERDVESSAEPLLSLFEETITDFVALVGALDPTDWERGTDLDGWSVHDVVSHTAHLEAVLAGAPEETVALPDGLVHVRNEMGRYTEQGVVARRDRTREELLEEIESSVAHRVATQRADPPDLSATAPGAFGGLGWTWGTLLGNRVLDVWMHEQDVRRAIGRPGHLHSAPAHHVVDTFVRSFGLVVAKRAKATPGTVAALDVTDRPVRVAVEVGEDGRGRPSGSTVSPDLTVRMTTESYVVLCGGRRAPERVEVEVDGDPDLALRVLAGLAVTP